MTTTTPTTVRLTTEAMHELDVLAASLSVTRSKLMTLLLSNVDHGHARKIVLELQQAKLAQLKQEMLPLEEPKDPLATWKPRPMAPIVDDFSKIEPPDTEVTPEEPAPQLELGSSSTRPAWMDPNLSIEESRELLRAENKKKGRKA